MACPQPRAATTQPGALLGPATYIHPWEVFIYLLFAAFPPDNPLRIPSATLSEGWGRGMGLWVSPLIDVGDITYHVCLFQINNISITKIRSYLGSDNEARSPSCPGSGLYWCICDTCKNSWEHLRDLDAKRFCTVILSAYICWSVY